MIMNLFLGRKSRTGLGRSNSKTSWLHFKPQLHRALKAARLES